ncbi:MAG: FAD-dependent oxidoreductase, partial [Planctomycetota bacterium]|nr:FAD-dependent oxidoreductase [Planctomycetota bacterium]
MKFNLLAQKGKIGKLELKNRIVFPPVNNNYTHRAFMTDESIEFYVARAKGGCGLVIIEATSVDYPRSRSVLNPAIDDDKYIPAIRRIADGCHNYGAKAMIQLSHVGRQTRKSVTGMDPIGPSPLGSRSALYPDLPKVLTPPEIQDIVELFGAAAVRAQAGGLDGVELIMGHGYLMNNFLTPFSNQRTDEYGGIKGGLKLCTDIVKKIKERCGADYPIVCRYNIDDFLMRDGNTPVEGQLIAQALERAGADAINASGGMRDSDLNYADHTSGSPRGGWLHLAERVKRVVNIPVMAVKRLSPEIAEEALRNGQADFICFGKQLIADPDYADKVLNDRLDDAIHCSSCCQGCYDVLWMRQPITCMVNPAVGRKVDYLRRRRNARGNKRVMVVGGGPAGCEAALEAAKKGHKTTLIEKNGELGGNYGICRLTRAKKEVGQVFAYLERTLEKNGVEVRLGTELSGELLDEIKPQVVIDATGSDFKTPAIEGADLPLAINPIQALDGSKPVGR